MISSPMSNNKRYSRNKYYSALKTGFKHLNPKEADQDFLKDDIQMPIYAPTLFLNESMFPKKGDL